MKCPKCGYNSFEVHNTCKKCAHDLTSYKDIHGIKSIVLPHESRTIMAERLMADKMQDAPAALADEPADMFSFEIPEDDATPEVSSYIKDDPFDFGDEAASPASFPFGNAQMSAQAKAEEEAFSDLLESSSQNTRQAPATPQPAGTDNQFGSGSNSFSWDDTPDIAPAEAPKPAKDDFDSLFGDTDDTAKK